jgi:hypothetical protein
MLSRSEKLLDIYVREVILALIIPVAMLFFQGSYFYTYRSVAMLLTTDLSLYLSPFYVYN